MIQGIYSACTVIIWIHQEYCCLWLVEICCGILFEQ